MVRRYALIGVEGHHDQAFVERTLRVLGFKRMRGRADALDPFWEQFIPKYPRDGDLYARLDMPAILSGLLSGGDELSVAIYAGGGSHLAARLAAIIRNHLPYRERLDAFGIIADADAHDANRVVSRYRKAFEDAFPHMPSAAGRVGTGNPRAGIYVLPDNISVGVLEHLLLDCGQQSYGPLRHAADAYIDALEPAHTGHWGPFSEEKARIAATVSILRPGQTNTVSIIEDEWITAATLASVPRLRQFVTFMRELLALPA